MKVSESDEVPRNEKGAIFLSSSSENLTNG